MAKFKFGDKVKTKQGQQAIVQEDQEENSTDVKIMLEGDDYAHILSADQLENVAGEY